MEKKDENYLKDFIEKEMLKTTIDDEGKKTYELTKFGYFAVLLCSFLIMPSLFRSLKNGRKK